MGLLLPVMRQPVITATYSVSAQKEPDWPHMAAWLTSSSSGQKCGDRAADKLPYLGKTLRARLRASKNQSETWNSPWNDSEKAAPLLFVGLAHKLSVKPVAEDKAADLHWVAAQSHRLATDWNSHLLHKRRSVYNQNHELQSAGKAPTTEFVLFCDIFQHQKETLKTFDLPFSTGEAVEIPFI